MSTLTHFRGDTVGRPALAIVAYRASWPVGDRRSGLWTVPEPVENAKNAFPTSSLDGAQNAPPTRPTRHSSSSLNKNERRATTMTSFTEEADPKH
jgi:hypothetical protein